MFYRTFGIEKEIIKFNCSSTQQRSRSFCEGYLGKNGETDVFPKLLFASRALLTAPVNTLCHLEIIIIIVVTVVQEHNTTRYTVHDPGLSSVN